MKKIILPLLKLLLFALLLNNAIAQNIFPATGRSGIFTTAPAASLQVKGGARIGTTANYVNIDSATGNLSFVGTSAYRVAGNKYAFQYSGNTNYGLFFNSTNVQYEFRNGSAVPVFSINANTGNSVFNGTLKVGAYTLPATDGTSGQVLKTNGTGVLTWSSDNGGAGSGWSLTGNAGTNSATNFIGTTDAKPLSFRVNNVRAGYLDYDVAKGNTSFGLLGLNANTTGTSNTAHGMYALYLNTIGSQNTATGYASLYANISGNYNSAHGAGALNNNNDGNWNTASGAYAMYLNTVGFENTATGGNALYSNTSGSSNTANGNEALYSNNGGDENTAVGEQSLYYNTEGWRNTALGCNSLHNNITGGFNTALGESAMYENTEGDNNVAIGSSALSFNYTGHSNTAIGESALNTNITGHYNTGVGCFADVREAELSYSTALGYRATITASNQVRIGSLGDQNDPTSIGGKVGWSTLSDGRVKKNIKENVPGLAFINKLKPITYNIDNDAVNKIVQRVTIKHKDGKEISPSADELAAGKANAVIHSGFIAQEVEKAAKSLNYDFSGVDAAKNDKDLYGLRYGDFVVPLVKAVQELSAKNDNLQKQIDELKALIVSNQSSAVNQQAVTISAAVLEQNIPNPFSNTTKINYTLPQKFTSAQIMITDKNGKTLKAVNISGTGDASLNIDAATLAAGAYQYALVIDGKLIATKQMILAR